MRNQFTPEQEEWLQALESGRYRQINGRLGSGNGYCCLGVACEILHARLGVEKAVRKFEEHEVEGEFDRHYFDFCSSSLPSKVEQALRMEYKDGEPKEGSKLQSLVSLNDVLGWSFQEIAAHIRKRPCHYFTNFDL